MRRSVGNGASGGEMNDYVILPGAGQCGYSAPHEWLTTVIPPANDAWCICGKVMWVDRLAEMEAESQEGKN